MKKVSVVILNWNGRDMLRTFLPNVIKYSQNEDVEVCVADNGSTDNSVKMLQEEFPEVRLILMNENKGFAGGYNEALKQVDSMYSVLLNSDVEVTEGWLIPLIKYMDTFQNTVACQPKIRSWKHKDLFEYAGASGGFIDSLGYPYCRGRIMQIVEKDEGQYDSVSPIFWATGAALIVRTKDFFKVGGLDERFFAHMEEIDLCWRFKSRGYQIVCIPQSTVYHVGGATLKKENPQKTYLNFRNNLLMLYKNLPKNKLWKVMMLRWILDYTAALQFLCSGNRQNAKAVVKARHEFRKMKSDFKADRLANLEKTISNPTRKPYSLLWAFYILGKKKFSQLASF